LLPSVEFLAGALAGYTESLPLKFAFCLKGLAADTAALREPQPTTGGTIDAGINFLTDAWGCSVDVLGASKVAPRIKELFDNHTLALYAKTLVDTLAADQPAPVAKEVEKGTKALVLAPAPQPTQYDLAKVLEIARLAVKGTKNSYLVILERKGVKDFTAKIPETGKLTAAPSKVTPEQKPSQRIEQGERFIVIPCHQNEKLMLEMEGTGQAGSLITVTGDLVRRYAFPQQAWQTEATIDATGQATFTRGEKLTPLP
jgi:hypothetical protein